MTTNPPQSTPSPLPLDPNDVMKDALDRLQAASRDADAKKLASTDATSDAETLKALIAEGTKVLRAINATLPAQPSPAALLQQAAADPDRLPQVEAASKAFKKKQDELQEKYRSDGMTAAKAKRDREHEATRLGSLQGAYKEALGDLGALLTQVADAQAAVASQTQQIDEILKSGDTDKLKEATDKLTKAKDDLGKLRGPARFKELWSKVESAWASFNDLATLRALTAAEAKAAKDLADGAALLKSYETDSARHIYDLLPHPDSSAR